MILISKLKVNHINIDGIVISRIKYRTSFEECISEVVAFWQYSARMVLYLTCKHPFVYWKVAVLEKHRYWRFVKWNRLDVSTRNAERIAGQDVAVGRLDYIFLCRSIKFFILILFVLYFYMGRIYYCHNISVKSFIIFYNSNFTYS